MDLKDMILVMENYKGKQTCNTGGADGFIKVCRLGRVVTGI